MQLNTLLKQARECRICASHLPLGCKPLIQGSKASRIIVIGQAPGAAAHQTGIPWDDRSGARLRDWLGVNDDEFYDPAIVAHMPMGFCFPGSGKSGDLRPRPECAPEWHERLLKEFKAVSLTVIIGKYAFDQYLSDQFGSITEAARSYESLLPRQIALPHPSPRNNLWLKKNPWFEHEVLPRLQRRVRRLIQENL